MVVTQSLELNRGIVFGPATSITRWSWKYLPCEYSGLDFCWRATVAGARLARMHPEAAWHQLSMGCPGSSERSFNGINCVDDFSVWGSCA